MKILEFEEHIRKLTQEDRVKLQEAISICERFLPQEYQEDCAFSHAKTIVNLSVQYGKSF